jgi:hypothetical protein
MCSRNFIVFVNLPVHKKVGCKWEFCLETAGNGGVIYLNTSLVRAVCLSILTSRGSRAKDGHSSTGTGVGEIRNGRRLGCRQEELLDFSEKLRYNWPIS